MMSHQWRHSECQQTHIGAMSNRHLLFIDMNYFSYIFYICSHTCDHIWVDFVIWHIWFIYESYMSYCSQLGSYEHLWIHICLMTYNSYMNHKCHICSIFMNIMNSYMSMTYDSYLNNKFHICIWTFMNSLMSSMKFYCSTTDEMLVVTSGSKLINFYILIVCFFQFLPLYILKFYLNI